MKRLKRLFSMLLACCVLVGIMPTVVFAENEKTMGELASSINEYFADFSWEDDDIISAQVFESEGHFINDEEVEFPLRAATKSAEWTHAANVWIASVIIHATTLKGYIDWGDQQEYIMLRQ